MLVNVLSNISEKKKFGSKAAEIAGMIKWSNKNKARNPEKYKDSKYFFDGHYWMQDTIVEIAGKLGMSLSSAKRAIKKMYDEGYLIVATCSTPNGRHANFYRINPDFGIIQEEQKPKPLKSKLSVKMKQCLYYTNDQYKYNLYSLSNINSYGLSTPIEGDDKRILAIPYFEEKFNRKVPNTERKKFLQNLAENPETTYDDLVIAIEQLYADPLMRISTTSLNRVFRIENVVKDFEQGKAELKAIGKRLKNNFTGTFPLVIWSQEIMRSKFARRAKFASQEDILNYGAMAGFETTFEDMYYKCYG